VVSNTVIDKLVVDYAGGDLPAQHFLDDISIFL
jgi:hypothetical protein